MSELHLMALEASYDKQDGALDRVTLKWIVPDRPELAYIAAIEPNDERPFPTEINVTRRLYVGPTISDIDSHRLSARDYGFKTEAAAVAAIAELIDADLLAVL